MKARRIAWKKSARNTNLVANVMVKGLHEAGWMVDNPKASMYIWAKIPEPYHEDGLARVRQKLLADAKVSVSPGIGFGQYGDTTCASR